MVQSPFSVSKKKKKSDPSFITGEGSPYYVYHPHAPKRIAATLPNAKLILILRKPSKRAVSHYKHNITRGKYPSKQRFKEVLEIEKLQLSLEKEKLQLNPDYRSLIHDIYSLKDRGIYVEQLQRYYKYFPKDQILVLSAEELFTDPTKEMEKVCLFLGIAPFNFQLEKVYNANNYPINIDKEHIAALETFYKPYNEALYKLLGKRFRW